jgi:hypothetical protein
MRRLCALLALVLISACNGDSTSPSSGLGTYALQTVNDTEIPFLIDTDNSTYSTYITGDVLVLKGDNTYTETVSLVDQFTDGSNDEYTESYSGTWTRTGSTITLTDSDDNTTLTGTLEGTALTIIVEGLTLIYVKQ